ncbi:hypothetical protein CRG98_018057 [Punica granatum]|uniref:Uncharacterized protein n=1 Tax=Punica granatum TaxID=22663 RepID=A0A2I0JZ11_PUNGR|nr:hypothetical protein CRG98_018057 [Punica granatum]
MGMAGGFKGKPNNEGRREGRLAVKGCLVAAATPIGVAGDLRKSGGWWWEVNIGHHP